LNSSVKIVSIGVLLLVVAGVPVNLAHATRFPGGVINSTGGQGAVTITSAGFKDADGELVPNVKVVWYIWNSTTFPPNVPTNIIIITHNGNYSITAHGTNVVLIDVISFDTRTNSTGWASMNYILPAPCLFGYVVTGSYWAGPKSLAGGPAHC
jgi:hypothetical protein